MLVFFPFFLFLKKGRYNIFHRQSLWFDLILQISSWRGCSHAQLLDPPQTLGWEVSRAPGHLILPHSRLLTLTLMKILKNYHPSLCALPGSACRKQCCLLWFTLENCTFHAFAGNSHLWLNIKKRVGPGWEVDEDGMSPQRASPHREMASVIPLAYLLHVRARDRTPRRGREHFPPPIYFQGGRGKLALFLVVTAQGVMDCGFNPTLPILRLMEIDPRLWK